VRGSDSRMESPKVSSSCTRDLRRRSFSKKGPVVLDLFERKGLAYGPSLDFAAPLEVRTVQDRRIVVAVAARVGASTPSLREAARQHETDLRKGARDTRLFCKLC